MVFRGSTKPPQPTRCHTPNSSSAGKLDRNNNEAEQLAKGGDAVAAAIRNVRRSFSLSWLSSLAANPTGSGAGQIVGPLPATSFSPRSHLTCASPPTAASSQSAGHSGACESSPSNVAVSRAIDLSIGNQIGANPKQNAVGGSATAEVAPAGESGCGGNSSSSCSSNGGSAPSTPSATPTPGGQVTSAGATTTADGEKKYSCDFCDYTSSWPSHLRLHRMRHTGEKPYACRECNFQTAWVGDLKRHQRVHTGERPYSCGFCDFTTAQKGNLNTHIRRYHSKNNSASSSPGPPTLLGHPALTVGLLSSLSGGVPPLHVGDHPAVDPTSLFQQMTSHFPMAALAQNHSLAPRSPSNSGDTQSSR